MARLTLLWRFPLGGPGLAAHRSWRGAQARLAVLLVDRRRQTLPARSTARPAVSQTLSHFPDESSSRRPGWGVGRQALGWSVEAGTKAPPGPWSCSGARGRVWWRAPSSRRASSSTMPGSPRSCLGGQASADVRGHRARWHPCRSTSRRASGPGTRSAGWWSCALSRRTRPASSGGCKQGAQRHRRGLARAAGGLPSDCVSEGWRWPGAPGYTPRADGYGT